MRSPGRGALHCPRQLDPSAWPWMQSFQEKGVLRRLVPGALGPSRRAPATLLAECQYRWNQIGRTKPRLFIRKLGLEVREGAYMEPSHPGGAFRFRENSWNRVRLDRNLQK